MLKQKKGFTINQCLLSTAAKQGLLVDRFFVFDGKKNLVFSEKDQPSEDFFRDKPEDSLRGRAKLFSTTADSDSVVEFTVKEQGSKKDIFIKYLDDIKDVLQELKDSFGFRFTASVKLNNEYLRDKELNNAPMNIGHILSNPDPETELASAKRFSKEGQFNTQQPNTQQPIFNVLRITNEGLLETSPRQYAHPIDLPQLVDIERSDNYVNRPQYRVWAIDNQGKVNLYYFVDSHDHMSVVWPKIEERVREYKAQLSSQPNNSFSTIPIAAVFKNDLLIKSAEAIKGKLSSGNTVEFIKTSSGNLFFSNNFFDIKGIGVGEVNYDNELDLYWFFE